jgi:hypothetical protein
VLLVLVSAGHSKTRLEGKVRLGRVVSRTVIVCTAVCTFPQASVAVHKRLITLVPPQLLLTLSL